MSHQHSEVPASTRAAVLKGLRNFEFEDRPLRPLGPLEVLVRIKNVGICGSDVHYFAHGKCGAFETKGEPLVLGHESSGIVEAIGSNVTHLKKGDRVALEPGVPCRYCVQCKTGRYNLCPDVRFLATPPIDGSFTTFLIHPADFCFKLPESVSMEEGALLEPLSVALHTVERASISVGQTVLILGAGPIGLVSLFAARAAGASFIIVTDIKDDRLKVAKELGANLTLRADAKDLLEQLQTKAPPIDRAIECSGVDASISTGIRALRPGGKLALIGRGASYLQSVPLFEASDREVDILGVFRYANIHAKAVALISSGQINAKALITHRFPLDQIKEAFELSEAGRDGAIKVMFDL